VAVRVWRLSEKREKALISRAFRDRGAIYLRLTDWLADHGGIELAHSRLK